ncbi:MAG: hypothetical protein ACR2PH_04050 [Desulfobulbia bacterium]
MKVDKIYAKQKHDHEYDDVLLQGRIYIAVKMPDYMPPERYGNRPMILTSQVSQIRRLICLDDGSVMVNEDRATLKGWKFKDITEEITAEWVR